MSRMHILALAAALFMGVAALAPTTASAENMSDVLISAPDHGKLQSFSKSEYYIRAGGTPPTLEALAANPRSHFRHEMAYEVFKKGFEIQLGRKLGDGALKRLLAGDKVRLVDCEGSIYTTGVDQSGNVSWFTRACASGEELLQLRVGNKWVVVASTGCLNLVNAPVLGKPPAPVVMTGGDGGFTPPATPPSPPVEECTGTDCNPNPPKEEKPCKEEDEEDEDEKKHDKSKGNNGWGNGDQDAPGNSGEHNNAENNTSGKPDPSHGGNAGGKGKGESGSDDNDRDHGDRDSKGEGKGKEKND